MATTRKVLNSIKFVVASSAVIALSLFRTFGRVVFCSFVALGLLALGRAGFDVNHLDIGSRIAGIVMGVSNIDGTLAGIIGVDLTPTRKLLEVSKTDN